MQFYDAKLSPIRAQIFALTAEILTPVLLFLSREREMWKASFRENDSLLHLDITQGIMLSVLEKSPVDLRRLESADLTLRGWMLGYGFG